MPYSFLLRGYLTPVLIASIIRSSQPKAHELLKKSLESSYWTSAHERIENQLVVWENSPGMTRDKLAHMNIPSMSGGDRQLSPLQQSPSPDDALSPYPLGAILPMMVTAGTVTRRAVEATWLTGVCQSIVSHTLYIRLLRLRGVNVLFFICNCMYVCVCVCMCVCLVYMGNTLEGWKDKGMVNSLVRRGYKEHLSMLFPNTQRYPSSNPSFLPPRLYILLDHHSFSCLSFSWSRCSTLSITLLLWTFYMNCVQTMKSRCISM